MPQGEPTAFNNIMQFVPIILVFVVMFWMMGSTQRKEKKRKEELVSSLRKGQRVQSIGGIIGEVDEIRDNEVVLIIDARNKGTLTIAKESLNSVAE